MLVKELAALANVGIERRHEGGNEQVETSAELVDVLRNEIEEETKELQRLGNGGRRALGAGKQD